MQIKINKHKFYSFQGHIFTYKILTLFQTADMMSCMYHKCYGNLPIKSPLTDTKMLTFHSATDCNL